MGDTAGAGLQVGVQPSVAAPAKAWELITARPELWLGEGYPSSSTPAGLMARMEEMDALSVGEPEFFDLKQPWLYSPR